MELLYSSDCPYCRAIAFLVGLLDVAGFIDRIPIESESGQDRLTRWHGPDHPLSPHLRIGTRLWWGVFSVGWRTGLMLPFLFLAGLPIAVWRTMKRTAATLRG